MAKVYRALSNIDHGGEAGDDGVVIPGTAKYFAYGDVVSGLPIDIMKQLWDAGVLEQVEARDDVKVSPEQVPPGADTPSEGTEVKPNTPDASSHTGTSPVPTD